MQNKLKILISTGIYPPKIGGPAQYSKNLKNELVKMGHKVSVRTYSIENFLPSGLRHVVFFLKIIPNVIFADVIFAMDTFSVGFPSVLACKLFGKRCVIRTGGDFLWEQYTERTSKKVLPRTFYENEKKNFSQKERLIFTITKWTLNHVSRIIFSTKWQRDIFQNAYHFDVKKTTIVENYYGQKEESFESKAKIFISSSRNLRLKNQDVLIKIFKTMSQIRPEIELFTERMPFSDLMGKIKQSYAVIQVSLGEISPNLILDAIRYNKPFICTKEVGIYDRIKDVGIFVDPLNEEEIEKAVIDLLDEKNYNVALERVRNFNFTHTWSEIAEEFLQVVEGS